jgi:esterase/lipase superfamily enzyme
VPVVRREHRSLWSPAVGAEGSVLAYGHYGRPVLAFPSEAGHAHDYEDRGMIETAAWLIEAGRIKLYCVDSFDGQSWVDPDRLLENRARQHLKYEDWILNQVLPFVYDDCGGPQDVIVNGASLGAFHATNFALRRADLFPLAICLSGVYDMSRFGWGERGGTFYFNNPMDYVANLHGDHLQWLRGRAPG